jgi:two-component system NtrC family sensor kinase
VGKGTGQGLSIAHNVIQSHGGQLDFDSEIGKGTTFYVRLPLSPAESEANAA